MNLDTYPWNRYFRFAALTAALITVVVAVRLLPSLEAGSGQEPVPDLSGFPWLYLRDGQPPIAAEPVIELIAVGDIMLGRGVVAEPQPFAHVAPWLQAPDLVLGNLEGPVASMGVGPARPVDLRIPASAAPLLGDAGFHILGLANNHSLDLGPEGLRATAAYLQAAGIDIIGAAPDPVAAVRPLTREVNGIRLAFLAFNAVPDPGWSQPTGDDWVRAEWNQEQAVAAIAAAHTGAHAIVVSIHWGYEYQLHADPAQRRMAQTLLEAGADLVVGHHPHVVQETETSQGGFVAYSLGNFVFDQGHEDTRQGLALRAFFDARGLRAVQALPVWTGPHPRLMTTDEAAPLLSRLQPPSYRIGFVCDRRTAAGEVECRPVEVSQTPQTGPFWSGEIDLTGDGLPEQVRRIDEQIVVYSGGVEVWRGLPEWRVVDLALGDPNDDGRMEAILALWKDDESSVPRSHPFIVGYRGGRYNLLWGGSAVVRSIHELELGDVTGDGIENLVVLEEAGGGEQQTVAVWRWHGWGFSLLWRSPPGRYHDLGLLPSAAGPSQIISVAVRP